MAATASAAAATDRRILGLDHAAIPTRDPYAAARFYTTALKAELVHETRHRSLFLGVQMYPGFMFDLFERAGEGPFVHSDIFHHAFAIGVEDVLWWIEHLKYWGVPFFANPRGSGSISIYVTDPDGNRLELTCPDVPEVIRRQVPAGLYEPGGSFRGGNKDTLAQHDQHPTIERWPLPEREAEAEQLFQQQLERVRARTRTP